MAVVAASNPAAVTRFDSYHVINRYVRRTDPEGLLLRKMTKL